MAKFKTKRTIRSRCTWKESIIESNIDEIDRCKYLFNKIQGYAENLLQRRVNESIEPTDRTFADISSSWMCMQKPQLKESSVSRYRNILKSYLLPAFGDRAIDSITRSEVTAYSLEMLSRGGCRGNGLSPKTVNSTLSVMKNVFKYARSEMNLSVADIMDVGVKEMQKPLSILSITEQQRICEYLYDNLSPCNLGILICMYTGIRIGEICALKWSDVNIEEQIIHVHLTMQRIQDTDNSIKKTKVVVNSPKSNSSIREIPIPDELLKLLRSCQKKGEEYLLTGMEHRFIEPRTMEYKFRKVANDCNIKNIKFHSLRHTFATRCVELGFDIKSLSEILGHASVNITLNRYVHPSMNLKQHNMNKLTGFITSK